MQAACRAHLRRKFFQAARLAGEHKLAARIVARIDELFAVDGQAGACGMDLAARQASRHERAPRLLEVLRAENAMRGVALGRTNRIHVGSAEAGPAVAAILAVVQICRRPGLDLRAYLANVLPHPAATSTQKVGELTPAAWAARRSR